MSFAKARSSGHRGLFCRFAFIAWSWSDGNNPQLLANTTTFDPGGIGATYKQYLQCIGGKTVTGDELHVRSEHRVRMIARATLGVFAAGCTGGSFKLPKPQPP